MTRLDGDGLTDNSHERRVADSEVNAQMDRSAKANGCDQVAETEEVFLGLDGKFVRAWFDGAVVEDAQHKFHSRDVDFLLLEIGTRDHQHATPQGDMSQQLTPPMLVRIEVSSSVNVPFGRDRHTLLK